MLGVNGASALTTLASDHRLKTRSVSVIHRQLNLRTTLRVAL